MYDGHGSHTTTCMVELTLENNIHLFCLPPHTTHKLQPLDVWVFGPLQCAWQEHCDDILDETGEEIQQEDIVKEYMAARNKSVTPEIVRGAWKKCGMAPLDPNVFTPHNFAPSQSTSTSAHMPVSYPGTQAQGSRVGSINDEPSLDKDSASTESNSGQMDDELVEEDLAMCHPALAPTTELPSGPALEGPSVPVQAVPVPHQDLLPPCQGDHTPEECPDAEAPPNVPPSTAADLGPHALESMTTPEPICASDLPVSLDQSDATPVMTFTPPVASTSTPTAGHTPPFLMVQVQAPSCTEDPPAANLLIQNMMDKAYDKNLTYKSRFKALEQAFQTLQEENKGLQDELDKAHIHCDMTIMENDGLQRRLNAKVARDSQGKKRTLVTDSCTFTSGEGLLKWQEQQAELKEKEQKKQER